MKLFFRPQALSAASHVMISFLLLGSGIALNSSVAKAQNGPVASKIAVTLTMEPSPAQKGSNTVRVKLTDSAGQPVTGAEVTVTFFMPAMPAMNMAAMKTVIKGADEGGGLYEGKGDLASGGIWNVTITARQNGQVIATKKLTVKATGGM
jgi:Cu(I)/Ag(I) efflux system membrane fusion protein/cobalt-zinc-cadmium efflux system membrane fusion protein